MLFSYKGINKNGKNVSGSIEAKDIESAKVKLKQKNIIIEKITSDSFGFLKQYKFDMKYKIKPLELSIISKNLSIYLKSGITIIVAIRLLSQGYTKNKKLSAFFDSIISSLDEGKNFYTALNNQNVIKLPEFYLQSIKVSEEGGMLKEVLLEMATYLKEQDKFKKQLISSLTYPAFIIIVSIFMVGFMLSFIVPKITAIFIQNGQELPSITTFVIAVGNFISLNYQFILIILGIFMVVFVFFYKQSKSFKYKIDKILLYIPFAGKIIHLSELARFAYMNAILIKSGVVVTKAFKLSSNILKNEVLKSIFLDATKRVVEGEKLSKYLQNNTGFKIDTPFVQAIAIGEETSNLSEVLNNLALLYQENNQNKINRFLTLLEPMMMLIVGGMIGFIVVAMLLPIFSMSIQ